MTVHEKFMKRCLELAKKGFGKTAPNPMVGCVIVYKEKIIGEGYHHQHGLAHAEVHAINAVKNKKLLKNSTLYVNLEPCSHFGKTPPCADLILKSGIKYVVIGTIDPNPLVKGNGLKKLASAGCDVKLGVLEEQCKELNKHFFTYYVKKRPYIILKWAETKDKYIGIKKGGRLQISNDTSMKLMHEWRGQEQAIMVGTNTALIDNPRLTVRKMKGKNPIRIVIDQDLKIPDSFHLLDGSVQTIIFTRKKKSGRRNMEYVQIDFKKDVLEQIITQLYGRNIKSLIVEGGTHLLNSFIQKGLWDEARIFTSKKLLIESTGKKVQGVCAPNISGITISKKKIGSDELLVILPLGETYNIF